MANVTGPDIILQDQILHEVKGKFYVTVPFITYKKQIIFTLFMI